MIGRVKFYVLLFLGAFIKWQNKTISSSCLSVHPHATTQFPLSGFSRNVKIEDFLEICRENSSFIKIWQE